jgi:hypothetical protein
MEVADALSARALEVAFASAMSVVATNGANAGNMHMAAVMRAQLLDSLSHSRVRKARLIQLRAEAVALEGGAFGLLFALLEL